ncbi:MAG: PEP-CTERM sorting domain-containing protein [Myxococcota bacterium]
MRRAGLAAAVVVAALVSFVAPGQATPIDVFFDGPLSGSTRYGISAASASAAQSAGVTIIDNQDLLTQVGGYLSVTLPPASTLVVSPNPPTSSLNRVTSNWAIQNVSGEDMTGANFLLFTNTKPYAVGSTTVDYPDDEVGLQIDGALGWYIIKATASGVDYYYPALLLDRTAQDILAGNVTAGASVSAAIQYVVKQALVKVGNDYQLPKLNLGFARVVIPEPGTALLLGVGLSLLAARRSRS